MLWETIVLAIRAIRRNALRSLLTILGIIIGVGAVITMVTLGNGTTTRVISDISRLGSNLLTVRSGQLRGPGGARGISKAFTPADVEAIRNEISGLKSVAPVSSSRITAIVGNENWTTTLTGTENGYLDADNWTLASGRSFLDGEAHSGAAVCIIGGTVEDKLFGAADPLGQIVRLQKIPCEVIGVLVKKGQGGFGGDQDDVILVPIRMFQRRIAGTTDVGSIDVAVRDGLSTAKATRDLEALLRERRHIGPGEEDSFTVFDVAEIANTVTTTTTLLTGLLAAVAAISLLVGGIGIMNIMLVSVTERTKEIGIRLAIGALRRQVLTQFLVEAVVLSLFGGIIGIALGLGLAAVAVPFLQIPFIVDPLVISGAFLFAAMVGVVFGYFPARRAANLNPIDALRHE